MDETAQLKEQLNKLHAALQEEQEKATAAKQDSDEAKAELKKLEEKLKEAQSATMTVKPVFMSPGRRLDTFSGRPVKANDKSIHEWITDVEAQLEMRALTGKDAAAFIKEHLSGDARKEITGRGNAIATDAKAILKVLGKVFGEGNTLPLLQQKFFGYRQGSQQDLLSCSLELVDTYDRICALDSSYKPCRESALKSRLAEAVADEALQRELRRLNVENTSLSFFQLRDRAQEWLGRAGNLGRTKATIHQVNVEQGAKRRDKKGSDTVSSDLEQKLNNLSREIAQIKMQTTGPAVRDHGKETRGTLDQQLLKELAELRKKVENLQSAGSSDDRKTGSDPQQNYRRRPRGPPLCYHCGEWGHMLRECGKPPNAALVQRNLVERSKGNMGNERGRLRPGNQPPTTN